MFRPPLQLYLMPMRPLLPPTFPSSLAADRHVKQYLQCNLPRVQYPPRVLPRGVTLQQGPSRLQTARLWLLPLRDAVLSSTVAMRPLVASALVLKTTQMPHLYKRLRTRRVVVLFRLRCDPRTRVAP